MSTGKQKRFEYPWGAGVVEEEAQIVSTWHKPTLQLLRYEKGEAKGSYAIRFCHYDLQGRFRRSPLLLRTEDIKPLQRALKEVPKLRGMLLDLISDVERVQ